MASVIITEAAVQCIVLSPFSTLSCSRLEYFVWLNVYIIFQLYLQRDFNKHFKRCVVSLVKTVESRLGC